MLEPRLRQFVRGQSVFRRMRLIELHPVWDFMILQSSDYPEVGIAVSDLSGSCGSGWALHFWNDQGTQEAFTAPCGCCDFSGQLGGGKDKRSQCDKVATGLIDDVCVANSIKFLLFHCWKDVSWPWMDGSIRSWKNAVENRLSAGSIQCIDPYNNDKRMKLLDLPRFQNAFGGLFEVYTCRSSAPGIWTLSSLAEFLSDNKE